jgi:hypothetical protein
MTVLPRHAKACIHAEARVATLCPRVILSLHGLGKMVNRSSGSTVPLGGWKFRGRYRALPGNG